jgi:hypothetical protein
LGSRRQENSMRRALMTRKDWWKWAKQIRAIAAATPDQITILLIDLAEEYEKRAGNAVSITKERNLQLLRQTR